MQRLKNSKNFQILPKMPIEAVDALKVLGYEDLSKFEKPEDLKTDFDKSFVSRAHVLDDDEISRQIVGRALGSISTEVKRAFREGYGVEFEPNELKNEEGKELKLNKVVEIGLEKYKTKTSQEIEALKATQSGDASKHLEKMQSQYQELEGKYAQEKELRQTAAQEVENLKNGHDQEKKQWKIDQLSTGIFSGIKFKQMPEEALALAQKGFQDQFHAKFKLDLNDSDELIVLGNDGKQVENTTKVGTFLTPQEAAKNLAVDLKVWEDNPHPPKPRQVVQMNAQQGQSQRQVATPITG